MAQSLAGSVGVNGRGVVAIAETVHWAPLGADGTAIAALLSVAGTDASTVTAAELDLTGDLQLIDEHDLFTQINQSVVIARGPHDTNGNTILIQPPQGTSPATVAQVAVNNAHDAIRVAALCNAVAAQGGSQFSEFTVTQWLDDMIYAQRY